MNPEVSPVKPRHVFINAIGRPVTMRLAFACLDVLISENHPNAPGILDKRLKSLRH